jgi:hypothetical protein
MSESSRSLRQYWRPTEARARGGRSVRGLNERELFSRQLRSEAKLGSSSSTPISRDSGSSKANDRSGLETNDFGSSRSKSAQRSRPDERNLTPVGELGAVCADDRVGSDCTVVPTKADGGGFTANEGKSERDLPGADGSESRTPKT